MIPEKFKRIISVFGILIVFNIAAWLGVYNLSKGTEFLEVNFFYVGQGDSIFIETPQSQQILIDGGPDSSILEKLAQEMPFFDRTIDLMVLTHPEHDHIVGLIKVLERYEVKNIIWTGVNNETSEFKNWQEIIKEEGSRIFIAEKGQKVYFNNSEEAGFIDILYPFESLEGKETKELNNSSVVMKLVFGENKFLFTGDIFKSIERQLLKEDIEADILKVSHHGSKTSSDEEFIKEVSPEVAVIQCGKDNKYLHPHPETLEVLGKYDIYILRTDLEGDIKIKANKQNYDISIIQN